MSGGWLALFGWGLMVAPAWACLKAMGRLDNEAFILWLTTRTLEQILLVRAMALSGVAFVTLGLAMMAWGR